MKRRLQRLTLAVLLSMPLAIAPCDVTAAPFDHELFQLTSSDPSFDQYYAASLAISGTTAIVGAPYDTDRFGHGGSVYLYDATTGLVTRKIESPGVSHQDAFGISVGLDGNTAIIGASGVAQATGAAYLYDTATGQKLHDLSGSNVRFGSVFGLTVGINGNTAIVGAPNNTLSAFGTAYLFDVDSGEERFQLTPQETQAPFSNGFGNAVAVSGNTAIVASSSTIFFDNPSIQGPGTIHVYDTTTGAQTYRLTASDATNGDQFGFSVAVAGNLALVSAINAVYEGVATGAAYLFDITTGQELAKLVADDAMEGTLFGVSVAINGQYALVGADRDPSGFNAGAFYVFDLATHEQIAKILASDSGESHYFGTPLALSDRYALVGAGGANDSNGAAYLYSVPEPTTAVLFAIGLAGIAIARRPRYAISLAARCARCARPGSVGLLACLTFSASASLQAADGGPEEPRPQVTAPETVDQEPTSIGQAGSDLPAGCREESTRRAIMARSGAAAARRILATIQGDWTAPGEQKLCIFGDRWVSSTPTCGPVKGALRGIDVRDGTAWFDLVVDAGPTTGLTCRMILRLDGDSLHYCGTYDAERPSDFKTEGNNLYVIWARPIPSAR